MAAAIWRPLKQRGVISETLSTLWHQRNNVYGMMYVIIWPMLAGGVMAAYLRNGWHALNIVTIMA